jgi:hypothetical protein
MPTITPVGSQCIRACPDLMISPFGGRHKLILVQGGRSHTTILRTRKGLGTALRTFLAMGLFICDWARDREVSVSASVLALPYQCYCRGIDDLYPREFTGAGPCQCQITYHLWESRTVHLAFRFGDDWEPRHCSSVRFGPRITTNAKEFRQRS